MKLNFKTKSSYEAAKTLMTGNGYRFVHYDASNSIRFYTEGMLNDAVSALSDAKVNSEMYEFDDYEYRMPALNLQS